MSYLTLSHDRVRGAVVIAEQTKQPRQLVRCLQALELRVYTTGLVSFDDLALIELAERGAMYDRSLNEATA